MRNQFPGPSQSPTEPARYIAYAVIGFFLIPVAWQLAMSEALANRALHDWLLALIHPLTIFVTFYLAWQISDNARYFFGEDGGGGFREVRRVPWLEGDFFPGMFAGMTGIAIGTPMFSWMGIPRAAEATPVVYASLLGMFSMATAAHGVITIKYSWRALRRRLQQ